MTFNTELWNGQTAAAGEPRSLRFNSADSAYLSRTPASAGNRKTWTWSGWVKRSKLGTYQTIFGRMSGSTDATWMAFRFQNTDALVFLSWNTTFRLTSQVFRDTSAWFHLVVAFDTTQATANDRIKIYVNGSQITAFGTTVNPTQNTDYAINDAAAHGIGYDLVQATNAADFYLADVYFCDGNAYDPSYFTEFDDNGILQPKAFTGSYGSQGWHLDFSDNSTAAALGYDAAGSNDWTVNNISVAAGAGNDSLVDVPTNGTETDTGVGGEVRGNYATLNPLQKSSGSTLSNGNLDISMSVAQGTTFATMAFPASGKWYFECTANATQCDIGIAKADASLSEYLGNNSSGYGYYIDGNVYHNNASAGSGASYTTGDIIGVAFDADAGTCKWYKNNALQVTISSLSGEWFPAFGSGNAAGIFNFGQRPFAYTAPSGFKALNTANLDAPVVTKPSEYMDVALYTGNGGTNTISGLEFSPDLVWIKSRGSASNHAWYDIIRGVGKGISSSLTDSEYTATAGVNELTAFNSDGFSLGPNQNFSVNSSSIAFAAWIWDAGSSTVSNTDGSITSSVRANASAGFSIVTYTAPATNTFTVGHGLGVAPSLILVKGRNQAYNWDVYHSSLGATGRLILNLTNAFETTSGPWANTSPTSTVFSSSGNGVYYSNGDTLVAYCFAPVDGYSSFGSYTGNGSADGPFVYTGFKPRWVMVKITSSTNSWVIVDSERDTYNVVGQRLRADLSNAEDTQDAVDFVSNGFKIRSSSASAWNDSGQTYIYAAFAENPFALNARAR